MGTIYEVIIVGSGPAGLTAGLYTSRAGLSTRRIENGTQRYSRLDQYYFEWKEGWYPVAKISSDLRGQLLKKWEWLFKELC